MTTRFSIMHALLLVAPRKFAQPLRLALLGWHTPRQHPRISGHNYPRAGARRVPGKAEHPLTHEAAPHLSGTTSSHCRTGSPLTDLAPTHASHRARATAPTHNSSLQPGRNK
jgi:hypothetical protein